MRIAAALLCLLTATGAAAAVKTRPITYRHGDQKLQGYLAWDDAATAPRPGVLVVHEWWGHNEHARRQARRLAEAGYVGFALDMFGKGKVTTHPEDAKAFTAEAMKDTDRLAARFDAALAQLRKSKHVDPARVAALGYCFGGSVVLNMARRGADLDAVASFHGSLGAWAPAAPGAVKARILVLNGADDPMVTAEAVAEFEKEMKDAGADARVVHLPGAKHGFTNPDADKAGMPALAYSAEADAESWRLAMEMLGEVFGK